MTTYSTTVKYTRNMKSVSQAKLGTLFRRNFQTLNARAARAALPSNVHQFCRPKSTCFMRETDLFFPGIFDVVWALFFIGSIVYHEKAVGWCLICMFRLGAVLGACHLYISARLPPFPCVFRWRISSFQFHFPPFFRLFFPPFPQLFFLFGNHGTFYRFVLWIENTSSYCEVKFTK